MGNDVKSNYRQDEILAPYTQLNIERRQLPLQLRFLNHTCKSTCNP